MSAILSADDLNDFISPGVACIKPVETLPKQEETNPYEVTTEDKVQAENPTPASISLTDCLACSGCVTSAEAVLVSLQSHTEVLNTLDEYSSLDVRQILSQENLESSDRKPANPAAKLFVASISPQVRASIAATFGISERRAGNLIEQFLSGAQGLRLGGQRKSDFSYVLDTNRLREACLVLGADEVAASISRATKPRPILTSACPGWICYAEKTHPHVLPHLSTLKSPQSLSGTLVKSVLSRTFGIHPSQIWHLAIMPCFDKKLEASREELTNKWWSDASFETSPVRDVDCVITSRELLMLADARGIHLSSLPTTPVPRSARTPFPDAHLSRFLFPHHRRKSTLSNPQSFEAGTSGGYLYHIILSQQALHPGSEIITTKGRNADVIEYALIPAASVTRAAQTQAPILRCARYYGFRNIQNLVRKLQPAKQSRLPGAASRKLLQSQSERGLAAAGTISSNKSASGYDYIEVMACPSGCTNGGGQIKVEDITETIRQTRGEEVQDSTLGHPGAQKEWLGRVDEAYFSMGSDDDDDDEQDNDDICMSDNHDQNQDELETGNRSGTPTDKSDHMDIDHPDTSTIVNGIDVTAVHAALKHWATLVGVPLETLAYTSYRKVESDVGKTKAAAKKMGDSERIAAIAGLQGGGW